MLMVFFWQIRGYFRKSCVIGSIALHGNHGRLTSWLYRLVGQTLWLGIPDLPKRVKFSK